MYSLRTFDSLPTAAEPIDPHYSCSLLFVVISHWLTHDTEDSTAMSAPPPRLLIFYTEFDLGRCCPIGRQGFVVLKVCGFHYLLRFDLCCCYSSVVLSIFSHKYHIQYYPHHEFSGDFSCYFSASQRTDAYQSDDVYCTAAVDSRKICVHIAY